MKWWERMALWICTGFVMGSILWPMSARADTTITLTSNQCIAFTSWVYALNEAEQTGPMEAIQQLLEPVPETSQLSKGLRNMFIGWLINIAKAGKGLSPLTHAQAFLTTCATEPVGEFVIAGDLI